MPDYEAALTGDVRGLKIGVPREYRVDGMPGEIEALWQQGIAWLRDSGAEPVEIGLPTTKYALPAYYIIAPAEASSNLARYDGVRFGLRVPGDTLDEMYELTRAAGFGTEVRRRVLVGTYVLSAGYYDAYYLKAQRVRTLIARDFAAAFERVDCLLTPTAPSATFAIGEKSDDPVAMYLNDVFTVPVNLAGLPAISVPAGLSGEGLPLGLQVIGRAFDEETVLRVGEVLERAAQFTHRPGFLLAVTVMSTATVVCRSIQAAEVETGSRVVCRLTRLRCCCRGCRRIIAWSFERRSDLPCFVRGLQLRPGRFCNSAMRKAMSTPSGSTPTCCDRPDRRWNFWWVGAQVLRSNRCHEGRAVARGAVIARPERPTEDVRAAGND